jgi:N-hydroxyarylamine O-acetyltransferase
MDIAAYLQRLNYDGPLAPESATLRALHLAHLRAVPFENLDIQRRPIMLDSAALFDKIVRRRRGGFCYELNGLFALLLEKLGFTVTLLSASDARPDGSYGPEFDHLALRVCAADTPGAAWLADVGWGDSFVEPLRLATTIAQEQGLRAYRLDPEAGYYVLWQRNYDGRWERQYRFSLTPRTFLDFAPMCHYHQTAPESLFTQNKICSRATGDGRISLENDRLIVTRHGVRQEEPVPDEATYHRLLQEKFGIEL